MVFLCPLFEMVTDIVKRQSLVYGHDVYHSAAYERITSTHTQSRTRVDSAMAADHCNSQSVRFVQGHAPEAQRKNRRGTLEHDMSTHLQTKRSSVTAPSINYLQARNTRPDTARHVGGGVGMAVGMWREYVERESWEKETVYGHKLESTGQVDIERAIMFAKLAE